MDYYQYVYQGNRIVKSDTAPANPTDGMLWYDTTNKKLYIYNSSTGQWDALPNIPLNKVKLPAPSTSDWITPSDAYSPFNQVELLINETQTGEHQSNNDWAQAQHVTLTGKISKAECYVWRYGSPTGTLYCRIRDVDGNKIAESSDTYDIASIPDSWTWLSFTFSPAVEVNNQEIYISFEWVDGSGGDANHIRFGTSEDTVSGNFAYCAIANIPSWTEDTSKDLTVRVYGESDTDAQNVKR